MNILLNHKHALGRSFVATTDNGQYLVGTSQDSAKLYNNATEPYNKYYEIYLETASHGAFNICAHLEDDFISEGC